MSYRTIEPTKEQQEYVTKNIQATQKTLKYFQAGLFAEYIGYLAEVVLADLLNRPRPAFGAFDTGHDLVLENGTTIDIKTRMLHYGEPRDNYIVKVYAQQLQKQTPPDYYLFCLYNPRKNKLFIVGLISHEGFIHSPHKKYEKVGSEPVLGYIVEENQYTLPISTLAPVLL